MKKNYFITQKLILENDNIDEALEILFESSLINEAVDFRKERVPARNINKLFKELNLQTIDRLYIDTEGLDVDIINSIDFSNFDIKFLRIFLQIDLEILKEENYTNNLIIYYFAFFVL